MEIESKLICNHCYDIFQDPITLTCCGDNICKKHIQELATNSKDRFNCPFCEQENTNTNLKVNRLIQNLLDTDLHKLKIDAKYKNTINNFESSISLLKDVLNNPNGVLIEYIDELKMKVDLESETLKSQIDTWTKDTLDRLEACKINENDNTADMDIEHYKEFIRLSEQELNDFGRCLNKFSSTTEEKETKMNECQNITRHLQGKFTEFKSLLIKETGINYIPMGNNIQELFGKVVMKANKEIGHEINPKSQCLAISILPDDHVVTEGISHTIEIWNIDDCTRKAILDGHSGLIFDFCSYNQYLISASDDTTIKVWDLDHGSLETTLDLHQHTVYALEIVNQRFLVSGSADSTIKLWDLSNYYQNICTITQHTSAVLDLRSIDNWLFASASKDKTIVIWEISELTDTWCCQYITTLYGHSDSVLTLSLLDNRYLVSGSADKTIKIWDMEKGTLKNTYTEESSVLQLISLRPGELVSGSTNGAIKIWNTETDRIEKQYNNYSPVYSLKATNDKNLVSASTQSIKIWKRHEDKRFNE